MTPTWTLRHLTDSSSSPSGLGAAAATAKHAATIQKIFMVVRSSDERRLTNAKCRGDEGEDAVHFVGRGNGPETGFEFILDGLSRSLARSVFHSWQIMHSPRMPYQAWALRKPVVCVSVVIISSIWRVGFPHILYFCHIITSQNLCSHLSEVHPSSKSLG